MPRPDSQPRHPLCPECGYDLSATVEARHRICPECGEEFEFGDLRYAPRPDDWTAGRMVRRLALVLSVKGLAVAAAVAIVLLVMDAIAGLSPATAGPFMALGGLLLMLAALIALGYAAGRVFSYRLVDVAGVGGVVVALIAIIFSALFLSLGVWSAHLILPLQMGSPQAVLLILFASSLFPIVRAAILDEL